MSVECKAGQITKCFIAIPILNKTYHLLLFLCFFNGVGQQALLLSFLLTIPLSSAFIQHFDSQCFQHSGPKARCSCCSKFTYEQRHRESYILFSDSNSAPYSHAIFIFSIITSCIIIGIQNPLFSFNYYVFLLKYLRTTAHK